SFEGLLEDRLRALLEVGGVAVARYEDVAGDEALEDVLAGEESHAVALLQKKNAARDLEELLIGDLKELVAREGLQDVDEGLAVVAARIEPGALDGALRFQAQHRDLAHAAAVRGRGKEAEEAVLADQVPVLVIALDADAIERHGTVDQTAAGRLGDDD